ncbi:MAG: DUF5011 domain-containing protein [Sulfurovaceae bacterium]
MRYFLKTTVMLFALLLIIGCGSGGDGDGAGSVVDPDQNTTTSDTTPPIVTLNGEATITLTIGDTYTEQNATAIDDVDGNVSVVISGTVDTGTAGSYTITYSATDSSGNSAVAQRVVNVEVAQEINVELESNVTIKYDHITLEVEAPNSKIVTALNETLSKDHNRTFTIKGTDNNGTFYLYNVPLVQGSNEINITATSENNLSLSKLVTLNADANGSAPIAMRAGSFEGVRSLQTTVEVGTLLDVQEYLFDIERDGVIDVIHAASDGNFTVNLTQEGRYKPRVTIRTTNNLLYSSGNYALSLDVKADANQTDPKGYEAIDEAKHYIQAIIDDDRESVEQLLGNNERLIGYVYNDPKAQHFLAESYGKITSWEQTYHDSGYASVKIQMDINGTLYDGGFEMVTINPQISTGRQWIITFFY